MATETTKRRITLERTYTASLQDVWDMCTTKEGIESWWGPDGFSVKVRKLDLRPGGECQYGMTATAGPQIEFMKKHGMPLTTEAKLTYTECRRPGGSPTPTSRISSRASSPIGWGTSSS